GREAARPPDRLPPGLRTPSRPASRPPPTPPPAPGPHDSPPPPRRRHPAPPRSALHHRPRPVPGHARALRPPHPAHHPPYRPRATPRVDHRLPAGVDLPAQVRDVQLDHVGLPAEVVRPDPVEDLRLAEHPPRIAHQVAQQLELGRREVDAPPRPRDLVTVLVE